MVVVVVAALEAVPAAEAAWQALDYDNSSTDCGSVFFAAMPVRHLRWSIDLSTGGVYPILVYDSFVVQYETAVNHFLTFRPGDIHRHPIVVAENLMPNLKDCPDAAKNSALYQTVLVSVVC